jgi:hypothetical protein
MVPRDSHAGGVIHCHIVSIVSTLARGGYSTCGAFDIKGLKCFAFQRFIGLAFGSTLLLMSFSAPASMTYQAVSPADEQADQAETGAIVFDIPPQPLLTALRAYTEVTGQAVLVDNTLTAGRNSPGVSGSYDKVEALNRLLAGTGLIASYSTDQAFTLKLAESGESGSAVVRERSEATVGGGIEAVTQRYAGQIQRPIEAALCQSALTRPGNYRLALQIWVEPSGKVGQIKLLTPMEGVQRDDEVRQTLNKLVLDPPPASMPQPITLLLLPGRKLSASACANASSQG